MSYTCIIVISTTLDTDELFSPVQVITVPRLRVTFIIVMVDTKGSAPGEETRANIKLAELKSIGVIVGF
jgi:hypothetical protein